MYEVAQDDPSLALPSNLIMGRCFMLAGVTWAPSALVTPTYSIATHIATQKKLSTILAGSSNYLPFKPPSSPVLLPVSPVQPLHPSQHWQES